MLSFFIVYLLQVAMQGSVEYVQVFHITSAFSHNPLKTVIIQYYETYCHTSTFKIKYSQWQFDF